MPADRIRLTIEDRERDGRGRGHVGGRVALVSQAHPGEQVVMRVDRRTRGALQGRVARIVARDPQRTAHECPHEFHCTGCAFLAAALDRENAFKLERLKRALEGLGVPAPGPVLGAGPTFGYRHHAKQVLARGRDGSLRLGSYVAGTHRVVDNEGCPVLAPALRALLGSVARRAGAERLAVHAEGRQEGARYVVARLSRASGRMLLVLVTSSGEPQAERRLLRAVQADVPELAGTALVINREAGNVLLAGELETVSGDPRVEEVLAGHRHVVGPRSFFQVNPEGAETLVEAVLRAARSGRRLLETHAGVGALTLPLTDRFEHVVAVEAEPAAVSTLRLAAAELAGGRLSVRQMDVQRLAPEDLAAADVLVMDPPRAGLGEVVARSVGESPCPRVVLVSCAPESLARDLRPLLACGLAVRSITPINLFPRTAHLETVTCLERERA